MKNTIKTRTVQFSNGFVKDASLKVPVGAHSIYDIVSLIRESYLDWAFRPERSSIMSDEVVTSSIGQADFFAGALGGYETRLDAQTFKIVKDYASDEIGLAIAVARYRMPGATLRQVYERVSQNEALNEMDRGFCRNMLNSPAINVNELLNA
jgi:hypothetical protein